MLMKKRTDEVVITVNTVVNLHIVFFFFVYVYCYKFKGNQQVS